MAILNEARLKSGVIFGDADNGEYVYMPAAEIGIDRPLCVYEQDGNRRDVTLDEALRLISFRSLRPTPHPQIGANSCYAEE